MVTASRTLLALVACCGGVEGGGGGDARDAGPPPDACALEVALGVRAGDAFSELSDGDPVEIGCGFQVLRCLPLALRVRGTGEPTCAVSLQGEVPGLDVFTLRALAPLVPGPDGARYTEDLLLPINNVPLPRVLGREVDLWVSVQASACAGADAVRVVLADDVGDGEAGDGGGVPPGDGGP